MGQPQLVQHRFVRADDAAGRDGQGEAELVLQQEVVVGCFGRRPADTSVICSFNS